MNRGHNRERIFGDDDDRCQFHRLLAPFRALRPAALSLLPDDQSLSSVGATAKAGGIVEVVGGHTPCLCSLLRSAL
jgi:hypothetical protein